MDTNIFNNDEISLMKHLLKIWRECESGRATQAEVGRVMEQTGDAFDEVHGEGSVRSIFSRINQAIAWKQEQSAIVRRCAVRVLGGQRIGDLAMWLNAADEEFLKDMGITL